MNKGNQPAPNNDLIQIGQVVGAHGVKGGIKVKLLTSFVERFDAGRTIFIDGNPYKVQRANYHRDQVRLNLVDLKSREVAESLQWKMVEALDEPLDLGEDEYREKDLIGLTAFDESGVELGIVSQVLPSPGQDLLVIGETLVPMVKEFVVSIDLAKRIIVLHLIEGLFDGSE